MFSPKKAFSVELKGRSGLLYREGERSLLVDSEMLGSKDCAMVVYRDSIVSWSTPFNSELITEDDKGRILKNITDDMISHGYRVEIQ